MAWVSQLTDGTHPLALCDGASFAARLLPFATCMVPPDARTIPVWR